MPLVVLISMPVLRLPCCISVHAAGSWQLTMGFWQEPGADPSAWPADLEVEQRHAYDLTAGNNSGFETDSYSGDSYEDLDEGPDPGEANFLADDQESGSQVRHELTTSVSETAYALHLTMHAQAGACLLLSLSTPSTSSSMVISLKAEELPSAAMPLINSLKSASFGLSHRGLTWLIS